MARTEPLFNTGNINQLLDFYQSLGFELKGAWKPEGQLRWCLVEFEGAPLMLQQSTDESVARRDIEIYISCDDVLPIRDKWIDQGVNVSQPHDAFYGERQIFVTDPDGRTICFESLIEKDS